MVSMLEYILKHKDYPSSIGYGDDNGVLHGRLGFIRSLVIHEGDDDKHLKAAFQEALDASLTDCEADKHKPDMPQKSSFNVLPGRGLHRRAMRCARRLGISPHTAVSDALRREPERGGPAASD